MPKSGISSRVDLASLLNNSNTDAVSNKSQGNSQIHLLTTEAEFMHDDIDIIYRLDFISRCDGDPDIRH